MIVFRKGLPAPPASMREAQLREARLRAALATVEEVDLTPTEGPPRVSLAMQAQGEVIEASDDDLALINERHSAQELAAGDVVVFQDYALHNQRLVYRSLQFTTGALEHLAGRAQAGRTVLFDHRHTAPIGAVFAADIVQATVRDIEARWLRLRWYAVLTDQTDDARRQLVQDCRTGVLRFGSVGMRGGDWQFQEIETDDGFDFWYTIDADDTLEMLEYSRVYMGAAQGAGDAKFRAALSATPGPESQPGAGPPRPPAPKPVCGEAPSKRRFMLR